MHRIVGVLQHYAWGHPTAIANIRDVEPSGQPEAEYWLGTHPRGPSALIDVPDGGHDTLDVAVEADPGCWLGARVEGRFGQLPFLFKILAADQPLSIQAHPDSIQALEGFDREDRAGIARDAFNRNYRDPNHKPELICAITRFEARCGFRALRESRELVDLFSVPEIEPLVERLAGGRSRSDNEVLREAVGWLLNLGGEDASRLVAAVVERARELLHDGADRPDVASFQTDLEWTVRIHDHHGLDIGVVVALLLNHVTLEPGQALFLEAKVMHAYLSGVGVELMANSDNVLRGGLTPKHIDVDELLSVVDFSVYEPDVQTSGSGHHRFEVPVPEFGLATYRIGGGVAEYHCSVDGPEIVLVGAGGARLEIAGDDGPASIVLTSGQAVAIPAATGAYALHLEGSATKVWRATVGR